MSDLVSYVRRGEVAVLTLNHPPVNVLVKPLRIALSAGLEQASRDAAVRAVVLIGAGKAFCAGAELADFDTDGLDEPSLHATISEPAQSSASQPRARDTSRKDTGLSVTAVACFP